MGKQIDRIGGNDGMKTFLLAFDSFKGSLTSREASDAFAKGLHAGLPDCVVKKVLMADGGEGTAEALVNMQKGVWVELEVMDPLFRPVIGRYGLVDEGKTAVIELASASGFSLLKKEERNPLKTSTYGTGQLMADALRKGCRKFFLGIGGSATNDAGIGLLTALGFRFLDDRGKPLKGCGESLEQIASVDDSYVPTELKNIEVIVACDVKNPLFGRDGAAYVFAPQKGADAAMVECLDRGLQHFAKVMERYSGKDVSKMSGAGAAGGVGGSLQAFLNARLCSGAEMILEATKFDEMLKECDCVVTGEGRIDRQTLMGKVPCCVLKAALEQSVPVIAVGGSVDWCRELQDCGFFHIYNVNEDSLPLDVAMRPEIAKENLYHAGVKVGRTFVRS